MSSKETQLMWFCKKQKEESKTETVWAVIGLEEVKDIGA